MGVRMTGALEEFGRDLTRLSFIDLRMIGEQVSTEMETAINSEDGIAIDAYFFANVLAEMGEDIVRQAAKRDELEKAKSDAE